MSAFLATPLLGGVRGRRDEPKAEPKIVVRSRVLRNNYLEGLFTHSQVLLCSTAVLPGCRRLLFPLLHAYNKGNRRRLHAGKGGSGLALFLDQTEAPKGRKMFLGTAPPALSRGLDDRSPPPTPHLKVWIGHLYWVICENERNEVGTEWVY